MLMSLKNLNFENNMMAKSTQNCHFLRYDVLQFNERYANNNLQMLNDIK